MSQKAHEEKSELGVTYSVMFPWRTKCPFSSRLLLVCLNARFHCNTKETVVVAELVACQHFDESPCLSDRAGSGLTAFTCFNFLIITATRPFSVVAINDPRKTTRLDYITACRRETFSFQSLWGFSWAAS